MIKKTRRILSILMVLLMVINLAACATQSKTASTASTDSKPVSENTTANTSGDPVYIGSINHVTGLGAAWGVPMQYAVELAVKEINEQGGVLGRPLKLIAEDDNTDADMALQKAKKLAQSDHVEAIFGTVWSSIRASIVTEVADPMKIPYFYPTYNEGGSTLANCSRYYICTGAVPNQQIAEFIPYLMENVGKKIYLLGIDEVMTTDSFKYIVDNKLVENAGGEIVGQEVTSWEVGDWSSVIQRIQESGADVVYPYIAGSEMISFLKQFYDFGLNKNCAIASVYLDETYVPDFPADLREGILCSASYFSTIDTPRNKEFVAAFQKEYGTDVGISNVVEGMYNAVWLWKLAIEKAGKVDKEAMIDALTTITFNAPQGEISVDPTNNHTVLHSFIAECQADGTFKILKDLGPIKPLSGGKLN